MRKSDTAHHVARREVLLAALAIGASPVFAAKPLNSKIRNRREARENFPHGVASGDPHPDSVIVWTRYRPTGSAAAETLVLEVAEDEGFERVVVSRRVLVHADSDWTCRVLVGGLTPAAVYWYRFTDPAGAGSRIGRTLTAPQNDDPARARFAFVSCQNANLGPMTPWRRLVFEDRQANAEDRLGFVLHLGDFVYDTQWQPEDRPRYFDREVRSLVRYPNGERHQDYWVPTTLEDYRVLYHAYLLDPDLQDARAWLPFVAIWDNGEFSNDGWQGLQRFGTDTIPAQTRKVSANQAWFENIPSRARSLDGSLARFARPRLSDAAVAHFDDDGLGLEPNNLAAIRSLIGYRAHRWGRHVEMWLTDQRSYRSEDYTAAPGAKALASTKFPQMVPFESLQAIDAGRHANGGHPHLSLTFGDGVAGNWRASSEPRCLLGKDQKDWFLGCLGRSTATWKFWANTLATFDMRADPQNLPPGLTEKWPGAGYAGFARTDHSTAYAERGEICDFVAKESVAGFVTLSGDRHSFWAGYLAKQLPPEEFKPAGLAFVVGSISSPGMLEALEHSLSKSHPLRALFLADRADGEKPEATVNLLLRDGVRTALDYGTRRDLNRAKGLSNPDNAPHVSFVDMGGHGYAIVTTDAHRIDAEFVCTARPISTCTAPEGDPLRYRVIHSAELWSPGSDPRLKRTSLVGDAGLSA